MVVFIGRQAFAMPVFGAAARIDQMNALRLE
jgi:hypothetical protein